MLPEDLYKLPLVMVCWDDITSRHGGAWFDLNDFGEEATCYTPGWIIKEDDKNIYMVSSFAIADGEVSGSYDSVIMKSAVRWIEKRGKKEWHKPPKTKEPKQT